MDELARLLGNGPSGGVAAAIVALGMAVLVVAWRAVPVYRAWTRAVLDTRLDLAATDARIAALARHAASADARIDGLVAENRALRAEVARLGPGIALPPHPGDAA